MVASAAVLTLAAVVCATLFRIRPGWPPAVVPRLDLAPQPADHWGASWEALSRPPIAYQREALFALVRTAAQLGAGTAVIALLSLVMHGAGRILAEWRSLAIRCALGARLRHLMRQVAGELCLLGLAGWMVGLALGAVAASLLHAAWPALLRPEGRLLPAAAGTLLVAVVVAGVLAGIALLLLYPLQRGVRTVADLHGDHITTSGGMLLVQNTLAMLQLAALLVVTYGSLLVLRAAAPRDASAALPYDPRTVAMTRAATAHGPRDVLSSADAWAGLGKELPLLAFCGDCFIGQMLVPVNSATVRVVAVAPGALRRMSVVVQRGREFEPTDDTAAAPVAVLSHVAASRLFPGADPIGRTVRTSLGPSGVYTIVGVAQSLAPAGLGNSGGALPMLYVALSQHTPQALEVATPGSWSESPSGAVPLSRRFDTLSAPLRWFAAIFALLALTSTGLGIFALAAAMTELVALRRRDIATRLAIGAQPRHIVLWIAGKALTITGAGVLVGLSGARWLGDVLGRHLGASVVGDLYALAVLSLAFGVVGVVASWRPARHASRLQPAEVFADPAL